MEKQQKIVEMAKDICRAKHICNDVCKPISACDALRYAERAVEAGYCKQEWISVDERLPDNSCDVLVYQDNGHMFVGYYDAECNGFRIVLSISNRVTHWIPLPEAPKGGEQR